MKKLLVIFVVMGSFASIAANYGPAGCGLGSILFENKKNDKVMQVLAATTNGTSGNQTFGITTGTLNCDTKKLTISKTSFLEANKYALANDIARGHGETLAAAANLYGCSNVQKASGELKSNYANIFPAANTDVAHINNELTKTFKKACI